MKIQNCGFSNSTAVFFNAAKSTICDSIIIERSTFTNNKNLLFNFSNETDKKGYYNVERLKILNNNFNNHQGQVISMLRGCNNESTMGPLLIFNKNNILNFNSSDPLISLTGTQRSFIDNNNFENSNSGGELIK